MMSQVKAISAPQRSNSDWYRELSRHLKAVDDGEPPGDSHSTPSLHWRLRIHGSFRIFAAFDYSYDTIAGWCDKFFITPGRPINLALALIDGPETFRVRFIQNLKENNTELHRSIIDIITKTQKECYNTLDLFNTVATVGFLEWLNVTTCHGCNKAFRDGQDVQRQWNPHEWHHYHRTCMSGWIKNNPARWWQRIHSPSQLISPLQRWVYTCYICEQQFEMGQDMKWNSCQRHAHHRECHERWEKEHPTLLWLPRWCPCLPDQEDQRICTRKPLFSQGKRAAFA